MKVCVLNSFFIPNIITVWEVQPQKNHKLNNTITGILLETIKTIMRARKEVAIKTELNTRAYFRPLGIENTMIFLLSLSAILLCPSAEDAVHAKAVAT